MIFLSTWRKTICHNNKPITTSVVRSFNIKINFQAVPCAYRLLEKQKEKSKQGWIQTQTDSFKLIPNFLPQKSRSKGNEMLIRQISFSSWNWRFLPDDKNTWSKKKNKKQIQRNTVDTFFWEMESIAEKMCLVSLSFFPQFCASYSHTIPSRFHKNAWLKRGGNCG